MRIAIDQLRDRIEVAHYRLGVAAFSHEIRNDFPVLSRFDTGTVPRLLRFLRSVPAELQLSYANVLVKRRNPDAVRLIGEHFTDIDEALFNDCATAIMRPIASEISEDSLRTQVALRQARQELRALVLDSFLTLVGEPVEKLNDEQWTFQTSIGRHLVVVTEIDTGGHHHLMNYHHRLQTGSGEVLKDQVSLFSMLGISGQTMWSFGASSDPLRIVETLVKACSAYFSDVQRLALEIDGSQTNSLDR